MYVHTRIYACMCVHIYTHMYIYRHVYVHICSLFTKSIKQVWEKITIKRKKIHFPLLEILTVLVIALNYVDIVKL